MKIHHLRSTFNKFILASGEGRWLFKAEMFGTNMPEIGATLVSISASISLISQVAVCTDESF